MCILLKVDDDEDDEAHLEALENWMNDEDDAMGASYSVRLEPLVLSGVAPVMGVKRGKRDSVYIQPQVSKKPEMTSRERARKASRDLKKELTDTTGGSRVREKMLIVLQSLHITQQFQMNRYISHRFLKWLF